MYWHDRGVRELTCDLGLVGEAQRFFLLLLLLGVEQLQGHCAAEALVAGQMHDSVGPASQDLSQVVAGSAESG